MPFFRVAFKNIAIHACSVAAATFYLKLHRLKIAIVADHKDSEDSKDRKDREGCDINSIHRRHCLRPLLIPRSGPFAIVPVAHLPELLVEIAASAIPIGT